MYKITIEALSNIPEKDYPKTERVYEQIIEQLDINDLVRYINKLTS